MVPRAGHLQQKKHLFSLKYQGSLAGHGSEAYHRCSMVRHRCVSGHLQAAPSSTPPARPKLAPWGAVGPFLVVGPFPAVGPFLL